MKNAYCDALGIEPPQVERVKAHREARPYTLLIVALLERGAPMTLDEVARRFEAAGVASADESRRALSRCKPGRLPVVRDGDHYGLDLHHDELDLWAFRLGLRPPRVRVLRPTPVEEPLPPSDLPLSIAELEELLRERSSGALSWSPQRYAVVILDAHGRPMPPKEVAEFLMERGWRSAGGWFRSLPLHAGAPVRVRADGAWELRADHSALASARRAAREHLRMARRMKIERAAPVPIQADRERNEARKRKHIQELERERRALVHSFPVEDPTSVVLLDIGERRIETLQRPEFDRARAALAGFDALVGIDLRPRLRALDFDPGARRLIDLGTAQKSRQLNRQGRKLKLTLELLIRASCGISRPFGERAALLRYLRAGDETRLRRRLEADAKSLLALYEYAQLHHGVRLRWGFLDELLPAPWVPWEEAGLYALMQQAHAEGRALEVVTGSAPGWAEPWVRARRVQVERGPLLSPFALRDAEGLPVNTRDVQAARLAETES